MRRGASGQVLTYADASTQKRKEGANTGVGPVTVDRTRQVAKKALGELTGNDLTLCWRESGQYSARVRPWFGEGVGSRERMPGGHV
jgi:hypothetical protein